MKLTITSHAKKQVKKLPKSIQIIIVKRIKKIAKTALGEEKLSGYKNYYRVRVGSYRIVYMKTPNEIEIILVAHKKRNLSSS